MIALITALLLGDVNVIDNGKNRGQVKTLSCTNNITCRTNGHGWVEIATSGDGGTVAIPVCAAGSVTTGNGTVLSCVSNISTATALASNPADCGANQYANAIAASGNLTCATITGGQISGAVATATALAANPTDCSAGQYATTIAASGNLTCAQVDYSQLSGNPVPTSPGGSIPQVQFNIDGGSFGGITNFTSPDKTHVSFITETTLPSAPAANLQPFAFSDNGGPPPGLWFQDSTTGVASPVGHRTGTIAFRGANGPNTITTCQYPEFHGSATMHNWGLTLALSTTSATAANWDAGTLLGRSKHVTLPSGTTANTSASAYQTRASAWRGGAFAGQGGFMFTSRQWFNCGGSTSCRVFVGLAGATGAVAALTQNTEYKNGVNNSVYIGADGPESNLHACSKDADAGQANCDDLGSSYPKTGAGYEIWIWAQPGDTSISYYVTRLDSAATVSNTFPGTSGALGPLASTQLAWHLDLNNTDAGRNVLIDFEGMCAWYGQ